MARLRYNALKTGSAGSGVALTLGASLTNSATTMTLNAAMTHSNGTAVPAITGSDYIPVSILDANGNMTEVVWITANTAGGTTPTILRGQEGTTGVAHSSGDRVVQAPLKADSGWDLLVNNDLSTAFADFKTAVSGTWAISSGVLRQSGTSGVAHITHNTDIAPNVYHATEVECSYISGSGTRRMGIFSSTANRSTGSGDYVVYLESTDGTTWTLKSERDGVSVVSSAISTSYAGTGFIRLGIVQLAQGSDIYLNGSFFASIAATVEGKWVGLYSQSSVIDFRNFKAWSRTDSPFS